MKTIRRTRWWAVILWLAAAPLPAVAQQGYKLAMMPRYFPERITQMITPLAEYLAERTGRRVMTVLTRDNGDYEKSLRSERIEIGYQNPLVYVDVSDVHEAVAMAVQGQAGDKYRGIVIVPADSPLKSIKELRHRRAMIVGRTSGGGYFSPRLTLEAVGMDLDRDLEVIEAADNKQENVLIAVSIGDVEVGFVRESALHIADAFIRPGSVQVLAECAWLPNWPLTVRRDLPPAEKEEIRRLILGLAKGHPVLTALGLEGFRPVDDGEYDVMRHLLGASGGPAARPAALGD